MACHRCGFQHNCICTNEPTLTISARFILLTHPKEQQKSTNTGQLLVRALPNCEVVIWHRTEPPQALLADLANPNYCPWLIFPTDEKQLPIDLTASSNTVPLFILLDATWQEARKMVRKTPWLNALPRLTLNPIHTSKYALRRNQHDGNLCTCESGIELLHLLQESTQAEQLQTYFNAFIDVFKADKSGHSKR